MRQPRLSGPVASISGGKTRGLGVTSKARVAAVPDLPPIGETLQGYETVFWQGIFGPAGMPAPVVARIEAALRTATTDQSIVERLGAQGISAWSGDAATLRSTLAADLQTWTRIIREGNIRAD